MLKAGYRFRANYSVTYSRESDAPYVSKVYLENLKDRAVLVHGLYLRLGEKCFLELFDFKKEPRIVRPFEAIVFEPDIIDCYVTGVHTADISDLIASVGHSIVVSTPEGRKEAEFGGVGWRPVQDNSKGIRTIQPKRQYFNGRALGSRVRYIVVVRRGDESEIIKVLFGDESAGRLNRLGLEPDFSSVESVRKFFSATVASVDQEVVVEVIDVAARRSDLDVIRFRDRKMILRVRGKGG